ncbi:hypothetical protein C6496_11380 [Candidatus Poribacteria bacterium]|nr:MAG: hypothetical protein C6496_11380 [Candidatus Poribacteria bacterium]
MCFQINRQFCVDMLLAFVVFVVSLPLIGNANETELPDQKLMAIFPEAKKFVLRNPGLTADQIAVIEKELDAKLLAEDRKPVFYIPISDRKKPMGLVLFANAEGPGGTIEGAVGLNMQGKVVKVEVYEYKESEAIAGTEFLKQFIGMGIDDPFKIGVDIDTINGYEGAANAVALLPKKTLVMSYALFGKKKLEPEAETASDPEAPVADMPEVEDLKALMMLMIDDYFVVVDYFDDKESKTKAIAAAKRLARYGKSISNFEPPKNADQTEEYVYLQDKFSETLLKFAEALEREGISDETRKQWDAIVELINQAHLRFSEEEIDLDTY